MSSVNAEVTDAFCGLYRRFSREAAGRAFAFNLPDEAARLPREDDRYFYYADKARFLAYRKALCPGALLIDGYLDNDFAVIMKK